MLEPLRLQQWVKEQALRDCVFVIASFDFDAPLISGFGPTLVDAWGIASRQPLPRGSVVCRRAVSNEQMWRDKRGREVRPEHFTFELSQGDIRSCQ